jgi:hypothetical protein
MQRMGVSSQPPIDTILILTREKFYAVGQKIKKSAAHIITNLTNLNLHIYIISKILHLSTLLL